jgi:hypothetical protein
MILIVCNTIIDKDWVQPVWKFAQNQSEVIIYYYLRRDKASGCGLFARLNKGIMEMRYATCYTINLVIFGDTLEAKNTLPVVRTTFVLHNFVAEMQLLDLGV